MTQEKIQRIEALISFMENPRNKEMIMMWIGMCKVDFDGVPPYHAYILSLERLKKAVGRSPIKSIQIDLEDSIREIKGE